MLKIISPQTVKCVSIWPGLCTSAFVLSISKLSFVFGSIWPGHNTIASDIIVLKITFINLPGVVKVIFSFSVELSVFKVPFVIITIKLEMTLSCFLAFEKVALVFDSVVVPRFDTSAMIHVVHPWSFVH